MGKISLKKRTRTNTHGLALSAGLTGPFIHCKGEVNDDTLRDSGAANPCIDCRDRKITALSICFIFKRDIC